jgi:hypothetical protein
VCPRQIGRFLRAASVDGGCRVARVADPVDHAVGVVGQQERAVASHGEAGQAAEVAPGAVLGLHQKPGDERLEADRTAVLEPDAQHLVARGLRFHDPRMATKASPRYASGNCSPVYQASCIGAACGV